MSLLQTIGRFFRRKGQRIEEEMNNVDPVGDAKLDIADAKTENNQFEEKIADLMASNNDLTKRQEDAQREVKKYTGLAQQAAKNSNRDDVTQFVGEKNRALKLSNSLDVQIKSNDKLITELRSQLTGNRQKIDDAEVNQVALAARLDSAKMREDAARAAAQFSDNNGAIGRLHDLEIRVEHQEHLADAHEQLDTNGSVAKLAEKYIDPDVGSEVDRLMSEASDADSGKKEKTAKSHR